MSDLEWILHQQEGQFFERKSCFDRSQGKVRQRPVRDVARDVAETLAATANADGGALVLGVEDDGAISGATTWKIVCKSPPIPTAPPFIVVRRK